MAVQKLTEETLTKFKPALQAALDKIGKGYTVGRYIPRYTWEKCCLSIKGDHDGEMNYAIEMAVKEAIDVIAQTDEKQARALTAKTKKTKGEGYRNLYDLYFPSLTVTG